jgi:hypothetical protein
MPRVGGTACSCVRMHLRLHNCPRAATFLGEQLFACARPGLACKFVALCVAQCTIWVFCQNGNCGGGLSQGACQLKTSTGSIVNQDSSGAHRPVHIPRQPMWRLLEPAAGAPLQVATTRWFAQISLSVLDASPILGS